jgi:hypothetical protein
VKSVPAPQLPVTLPEPPAIDASAVRPIGALVAQPVADVQLPERPVDLPVPHVALPDPAIVLANLVDVSAPVEDALDEPQPDAEASVSARQLKVVAEPNHVAEPSASKPAGVVAPPTTDVVDEHEDAAAAPADVPEPQVTQVIPVHDTWPLEPRVTQLPVVVADAIAMEIIAENLAVVADQLTPSVISPSPVPFAAQSVSASAPRDSSNSDPIRPDLTPPFSALPASIGLSSGAAAGWLPSFTPLAVHDVWRPWSYPMRRVQSVIVLPNLAPPG